MADHARIEPAAPHRIEDALDYARFDEIAQLADRASSYWQSIELAADRGDTLTVAAHCKQVAAVTREALKLVATLGTSGDTPA